MWVKIIDDGSSMTMTNAEATTDVLLKLIVSTHTREMWFHIFVVHENAGELC